MSDLTELLARSTKVGAYAAKLEMADEKRGSQDNLHHLGDDTGDLVTKAYREHGAEAAAKVIEAYLVEFNSSRAAANLRPVSPQDSIANLGWAIKPQGLTDGEQDEVSSAFNAHNGVV